MLSPFGNNDWTNAVVNTITIIKVPTGPRIIAAKRNCFQFVGKFSGESSIKQLPKIDQTSETVKSMEWVFMISESNTTVTIRQSPLLSKQLHFRISDHTALCDEIRYHDDSHAKRHKVDSQSTQGRSMHRTKSEWEPESSFYEKNHVRNDARKMIRQ